VAISAAGSRKPKIAGAADDPEVFPPTVSEKPDRTTADETSAAERNLIGLPPKVSKVAQRLLNEDVKRTKSI